MCDQQTSPNNGILSLLRCLLQNTSSSFGMPKAILWPVMHSVKTDPSRSVAPPLACTVHDQHSSMLCDTQPWQANFRFLCREWSLILGGVILAFGLLPSFRSVRLLNIIALVGTNYSCLYFLVFAAKHGRVPGAITRCLFYPWGLQCLFLLISSGSAELGCC